MANLYPVSARMQELPRQSAQSRSQLSPPLLSQRQSSWLPIIIFSPGACPLRIPGTNLLISADYPELYGVVPAHNAYGISLPQSRHPARGPVDLPV